MQKAQKTRLIILLVGAVVAGLALYLAVDGLRDKASLFRSPTELAQIPKETLAKSKIRLGGLVLEGSLKNLKDGTKEFTVTDFQKDIIVRYKGILPDLFREGQGVYVDGAFAKGGKIFVAQEVLAKHDENYTPPMPGE